MKFERKLVHLKVGCDYKVDWGYIKETSQVHRFIKPTRCGYNFLNLKNSSCILIHHLYPSKLKNKVFGEWFFINKNLEIEEIVR